MRETLLDRYADFVVWLEDFVGDAAEAVAKVIVWILGFLFTVFCILPVLCLLVIMFIGGISLNADSIGHWFATLGIWGVAAFFLALIVLLANWRRRGGLVAFILAAVMFGAVLFLGGLVNGTVSLQKLLPDMSIQPSITDGEYRCTVPVMPGLQKPGLVEYPTAAGKFVVTVNDDCTYAGQLYDGTGKSIATFSDQVPYVAPTPVPVSSPIPGAASPAAPLDGSGAPIPADCVLGVTNFTDRPAAMVDTVPVTLQLRGKNECPSPAFYDPTGVKQGDEYRVDLPDNRWVALIVGTTASYLQDGTQTWQEYTDAPALYICGPWFGVIGIYEGAIRVSPIEWADLLMDGEALPIHNIQVGRTVTTRYINCVGR